MKRVQPYQMRETWRVTKPAVRGERGLVSTQHYLASEAGASILRAGGNAADAAVAAGLALGVVEPWMSGIGGGGFMQWMDATSDATLKATSKTVAAGAVSGVDFAMVSPQGLDPADYPLVAGTNAADKFNWPTVFEDRHTTGPYSIAVPGYLAGICAVLTRYGTMSLADVMAPALELVRFGLPLDWLATQKISNNARDLRNYAASARMYLPHGLPPVGPVNGEVTGLPWRELVTTYEALATDGIEGFYSGALAATLAQDAHDVGSSMRLSDLQAYSAHPFEGKPVHYRDARVWAPQGLNAGPSLEYALSALQTRWAAASSGPDGAAYAHYADVLLEAYARRLATMGVASGSGNTSHLGVIDGAGNVVSWTQTIMSAFGSKVVMPSTGITMNNGIMWFDPVPGRPNSIQPGVRPLSNMCPAIVELANGCRLAVGACGGRKILPAVFQLISFMVDYRMSLEEAMHTPRIDVSGTDEVAVDNRLSADVVRVVSDGRRCKVAQHGVYPNQFALPNIVALHDGVYSGGAFIMSPTAAVIAV